MAQNIIVQTGNPVGYQQLTADATARALTVPTSANRCVITSQTATYRWRDDGTDPTSTVGMPITNGQTLTLEDAASMAAFKAIRTTGTSAVLNISYYIMK